AVLVPQPAFEIFDALPERPRSDRRGVAPQPPRTDARHNKHDDRRDPPLKHIGEASTSTLGAVSQTTLSFPDSAPAGLPGRDSTAPLCPSWSPLRPGRLVRTQGVAQRLGDRLAQ